MRRKTLTHLSHYTTNYSSIDLTPLIDVVFVVLIMFILVAPMLELDKVKLAQGSAKEQPETTSFGNLVIHVREDNSIWINKLQISPENLRPLLQALHTKKPDCFPQLFHDRKAHFGTYQMIKNAVEEAGFEQLDVVLEPAK